RGRRFGRAGGGSAARAGRSEPVGARVHQAAVLSARRAEFRRGPAARRRRQRREQEHTRLSRGTERVSQEMRQIMRNLNVPMYDPEMVRPMREELTRLGFEELRTPEDVDAVLASERSPTLVVVKSVCGCSALNARLAVALSIQNDQRPDRLVTYITEQYTDPSEENC